jgi:flagellar biosynthesis protein FliR
MSVEGIVIPTNLFHWSISQFQNFVLIVMRVSPILFMMPVFSGINLPNPAKASLTLAVSLVLLPVVSIHPQRFPAEAASFGFYMVGELMIGFLLALSVKLIFAGIQLAGEFSAYQMGLAMANILDPQSGASNTLVAEILYLASLLVFLAIDGHHWFFQALVQSFTLLAPGEFHLKVGLYEHLLRLSGNMFVIAVKITAPIMAVMIFTQIALGLVAKTVPQINVWITSFPITITLGLVFLGLSIDLFFPYIKSLFEDAGKGLVFTMLPLLGR